MRLYSAGILIQFLFTLTFFLHTVLLKKKTASVRLFLMILLSIMLWLTGAFLAYESNTRESAHFWFDICSIGFLTVDSFILHFVLIITGTKRKHFLIPLIYLPSVINMILSFTIGAIFSDFILVEDIWIGLVDYRSPSTYTVFIHSVGYQLLSCTLLLKGYLKTTLKREKKQYLVLIISILLASILYNGEPILLPLLFQSRSLMLSPLFSFVWLFGIWIAITRFSCMNLLDRNTMNIILQNIQDSVFYYDFTGTLLFSNRDSSHYELNIKMMEKPQLLNQVFHRLQTLKNENWIHYTQIEFENKVLPVKVIFNRVIDCFGDIRGFLMIIHLLDGPARFIKKYKLSLRESEVLMSLIDGKSNRDIGTSLFISERTVKNHISSIFNKTGTKSRLELISQVEH